jgi:hypothetical protein
VKSESRDLNPWSSDDVSRNSLFPEAYLDHILNPGGGYVRTRKGKGSEP